MSGMSGAAVSSVSWRVSPDASTCTSSQKTHCPVSNCSIRYRGNAPIMSAIHSSASASINVQVRPLELRASQAGANCARSVTRQTGSVSGLVAFKRAAPRRGSLLIARADDFDGDDDDLDSEGAGGDEEDAMDDEMEFEIERDVDMPPGSFTVRDLDGLDGERGEGEEREGTEVELVDYKIKEEEFHKLKLFECDFFIRKVPDEDDDMFDFREVGGVLKLVPHTET